MEIGKIIYDGLDNGLYHVSRFNEFMEEFEGTVKIFNEMNPLVTPRIGIYHIIPKNVTLKYHAHVGGGNNHQLVSITLFGNEEGMGEVERLILEGAEKA